MTIIKSAEKYEAWLRAELKGNIDEDDLAEKHKKMADGAFQFLRATYWRWAETIYQVCPELKGAPHVLSVGDLHIENFGTWRDSEGRLIWGVNDFDEAARMPYAIDIVRLATSAILADVSGIAAHKICDSILAGYLEGIKHPKPLVLDRDNHTLRKVAVVSEKGRRDFWKKFDPEQIKAKAENQDGKKDERPKVRPAHAMRPRFRKALEWGRPDESVEFEFYERTAGTGSLGRRRYFAVGTWRGDFVIREAKAIVPSGWTLAHGGSRELLCEEIATGEYRSPDPFYTLRGRVLLRRLSPNDFKIEAKAPGKEDDQENNKAVARAALVNEEMLRAMGQDLASIHRATRNKALLSDLEQRPEGWLLACAKAAAKQVESEFKSWAAAYRKSHKGEDRQAKKGKKKSKKKKPKKDKVKKKTRKAE